MGCYGTVEKRSEVCLQETRLAGSVLSEIRNRLCLDFAKSSTWSISSHAIAGSVPLSIKRQLGQQPTQSEKRKREKVDSSAEENA